MGRKEYSNSDFLKGLSMALDGDCEDSTLWYDDFIKGQVSLEAHELERIVSLAQANMCTITE